MAFYLVRGDALYPACSDLIAQTRLLPVGEPCPDGWRVLSGNASHSEIGRVLLRDEWEGDAPDVGEPDAGEPGERLWFCVDGYETESRESNLAGDGAFPPFLIFNPPAQDYVPGAYPTREEAEAVADYLNRAVASYPVGEPDVRSAHGHTQGVDLMRMTQEELISSLRLELGAGVARGVADAFQLWAQGGLDESARLERFADIVARVTAEREGEPPSYSVTGLDCAADGMERLRDQSEFILLAYVGGADETPDSVLEQWLDDVQSVARPDGFNYDGARLALYQWFAQGGREQVAGELAQAGQAATRGDLNWNDESAAEFDSVAFRLYVKESI